jgi:PTS system nitrogen regulatory IIA component
VAEDSVFPDNFLVAERIRCKDPAASKKRALQQVGKLLALSSSTLDEDAVFEKLLARERLGSTGLGYGIALPHARMEGITEARGAFIQLENPVQFDAIDNQMVDLVFGLMVPQSATDEHLQLLAKLASLFSDGDFCKRLREAQYPEDVLRYILYERNSEQAP